MNKYQFLIRQRPGQNLAAFKHAVWEEAVPALAQTRPQALKLSLTDSLPPRLTILPLRRSGVALISVWSEYDPCPQAWRHGELPWARVDAYKVAESVPRAYPRDWPDGQASPGICLLTLLRKHPNLSHAEFMAEWHGRHTPKALRIHPLWNYIRNVVEAPLIESSRPADGLVEEHFRQVRDVLNPVRMFGGGLRFLPQILEVYRHVSHFLDLKQCENYWLTEYHLDCASL